MGDLPFELVECPPYRMQLLQSRCVAQWQSVAGKPRHTLERLQHCSGCPIGAERAGIKVESAPPPLPRFCCRCLTLSPRLIGRRLCPSCYNRELEIRKGRNARGTAPTKAQAPKAVALVVDGQRVELEASGPLELALFSLRQNVAAAVGRAPVRVGDKTAEA